MVKDPGLDEIHEANMRVALAERSGAHERGVLLSEVTGRGMQNGAWRVDVHHILGRNKPKGFKGLHPVIQEFWPHIPPLCMLLTRAEHTHSGRNTVMMRPLLLRWILAEYPEETWQGESYSYWLKQEPAGRWL